jgi:hypothetical protein
MKFEELKFDKEQYNIMKTAEEYKQELSNLHYDIQSTIDAICARHEGTIYLPSSFVLTLSGATHDYDAIVFAIGKDEYGNTVLFVYEEASWLSKSMVDGWLKNDDYRKFEEHKYWDEIWVQDLEPKKQIQVLKEMEDLQKYKIIK